MRLRKLRIAWSVFWALASLVFLILWIRSYTWGDSLMVRTTGTHVIGGASNRGALLLATSDLQTVNEIADIFGTSRIHFESEASSPAPPQASNWDFGTENSPYPTDFIVTPLWFPMILSGTFAIPWLLTFRRFSLRTLLLATTLVAVVLGVIVWIGHQ